MKISITLDDRDWSKVAGAIEHALGFERRIIDEIRGAYKSHDALMGHEKRVANLARIKHLLWSARKVNRVFGGITPEKVAAFNMRMYRR